MTVAWPVFRPYRSAWSVGRSVCLSVCLSVTLVSPAKTAELIKMPFGLWTQMGPKNRVLDGNPHTMKHVAMATTFWLLMGYNFGCVTASGTIFDSRYGFSGSSYLMKS